MMTTKKNDIKLEDLEIIQDLSDEQSSLLVGGASCNFASNSDTPLLAIALPSFLNQANKAK